MPFFAVINTIKGFGGYDAEKRKVERQNFIKQLPTGVGFNKKTLNGPPLEHVFLIKEIYQL